MHPISDAPGGVQMHPISRVTTMIAPSDAVRFLPSRATSDHRMSLETTDPDGDDIEPPTITIAVNRRLPWHAPTVIEVPIECLPTELRLMALGLSSGVKPEYRPEDLI